MKRLNELKQLRAAKAIEIKNLIPGDNEERVLSDDDNTKFDALEAEITKMDSEIRRLEKMQAISQKIAEDEARKIPRPSSGGEERDVRKILKTYSIAKAVRAAMPGQKLEGLEREMHEEAMNEASTFGRNIEGIGVPSMVLDLTGRGLTVGANNGADGGVGVANELGELIPVLAPRTKAGELGINIVGGLTSNFSMPRDNGLVESEWEGEIDENAESNTDFDLVSFSPKRLGSTSTYSTQLLLQASFGVDALVKRKLERSIARSLDKAIFNGGGVNDPRGILALATAFEMGGVDGGNLTRDKLIDMITQIKVDDADINDMSFLMTNGISGYAQKLKLDAGSGQFLMKDANDQLVGYNQMVSNLMPKNLSKGSNVGNLHSIIFGVFSEYLLGNWGGLDLISDPYSKKKKAQIEITANTWWDGNALHDKAFVAAKDILV